MLMLVVRLALDVVSLGNKNKRVWLAVIAFPQRQQEAKSCDEVTLSNERQQQIERLVLLHRSLPVNLGELKDWERQHGKKKQVIL